jgi:hypothetical protein
MDVLSGLAKIEPFLLRRFLKLAPILNLRYSTQPALNEMTEHLDFTGVYLEINGLTLLSLINVSALDI